MNFTSGKKRNDGLTRSLTVLAVAATLTVSFVGHANAQIITMAGVFAGTMNEGFESYSDFLHSANPTTLGIFGNGSTVAAGGLLVYKPGTANVSLGTSGNATVADGVNAATNYTVNGTTTINFASTIREFGAFFGAKTTAVDDPTTVTVSFFDSSNNQIGTTQSFTYTHSSNGNGALDFHAWKSISTDVKKITIFGQFIAMDAIRANATTFSSQSVPENGSMTLVLGLGVIGSLGIAARRRSLKHAYSTAL